MKGRIARGPPELPLVLCGHPGTRLSFNPCQCQSTSKNYYKWSKNSDEGRIASSKYLQQYSSNNTTLV